MSDADRARWQERWSGRHEVAAPHPFVEAAVAALPRSGRALDLGGGGGRHAVLLAAHGLDVTVADIAPAALALADRVARAEGLTVRGVEIDVEADGVPAGPWDVVLISYFRVGARLDAVVDALAPGGTLVLVHPTRSNLERNARPAERVLLDDGEIARWIVGRRDVHVVTLDEGWGASGAHEVRLVARRREVV